MTAAVEPDVVSAPLLDDVLPRATQPGRITNPDEVDAIAACIAYGRLPFWTRWTTPAPSGWRQHHNGDIYN